MAVWKVVSQFQDELPAVPNDRRRTMEELQPKPGDRIAPMNGFAIVPLEPLIEVVSQHFDQQIQLVGLKIPRRNPVDGKPVLGFLDVIFHAAALIVEAPHIDRFPLQVGDDRLILPVRIENQPPLAVIGHLRLADDRHTAGFLPGGGLVQERDSLDDPLLVLDIAFPVSAGLHFLRQTTGPLQLACVTDSFTLPQAVELLAAKSLVEPGILHRPPAQKFKRLLQEGSGIRRGVCVAGSEHGVQAQAGLAFEHQKGMVALPTRFMRIGAFGRAGLIAVYRFHRRIQIQDQFGGQTRPNDFLVDFAQIQLQVGTEPAKPHQFLVEQGVMGTPSAEKTADERIILQLAKMKEPLAAEHPADNEIQQDAVEGKQRVVCLRKR